MTLCQFADSSSSLVPRRVRPLPHDDLPHDPPTRARSGLTESPARHAYARHVPKWVSAAEGAILGLLCWLALSPLFTFLPSTTFPALRGLAFGHWKLGKSFLLLLGLFYPLHLLSHGGFT